MNLIKFCKYGISHAFEISCEFENISKNLEKDREIWRSMLKMKKEVQQIEKMFVHLKTSWIF